MSAGGRSRRTSRETGCYSAGGMLDLYAELRSVVGALDRAAVDHALVGGLAVSVSATPRATEAIDLLVDIGDLDRAASVLAPLGVQRAGRPMRLAAGRPRGARTRTRMTPPDVGATFRKVTALRALCLRLPHLPTPREESWMRRFDIIAAAPSSATPDDGDALAAGWRRWWRQGRREAIAVMARALPAGILEADRRLASFACAAQPPAEGDPPRA